MKASPKKMPGKGTEQNARDKFEGMRRLAEVKLRNLNDSAPNSNPDPRNLTELIHELEVHQIELEMQNDELLESRRELEAAREDFFNLYEMSPVGYLVLDENGTIVMANLAGAQLLGKERSYLRNSVFAGFMPLPERRLFNVSFLRARSGKKKEICEVKLVPANGGVPLDVHLELIANRVAGAGCQGYWWRWSITPIESRPRPWSRMVSTDSIN